jgi:tripartite-type tricarboxylate transporter receptor subunit TctC
MIGHHIAQYIPGKPIVIFRNMPGASSRTAANWLYNEAPKDGLSIGALMPQALLEPLLGDASGIKYDPLKFEVLGSAASLVYLCDVRFDSPAQTFEEAQRTEIMMGTSAPGSAGYDTMMTMKRVLGAKFRVITGYPSSPATALAVERGEVDGACGGTDQINPHLDFMAQSKLRVIVQFGLDPNPRLTAMGAPPVWNFVHNNEDRTLLKFLMAAQAFGRPYVMPPDSPPQAVTLIRTAFDHALKDPDFLSEAERATLEISPLSAARMHDILTESYAVGPDVIARARAVLQ